jgi:hypothetical protein
VQAVLKFHGGLIGEGDDSYFLGGYSQLKEGGDTSGYDFGFAGPCTRYNEASFIGGEGGLTLMGVQGGVGRRQKVFKDGVFILFGKEGNKRVHLWERFFWGVKEGEDFVKHVYSFISFWGRWWEGIISLPTTGSQRVTWSRHGKKI